MLSPNSGNLRQRLVEVALQWQERFGNAPAVTAAISEYDAAKLIGLSGHDYSSQMQGRAVVAKGYDFEFRGKRFQVKANRPSGRPGSGVTLVAKAKNYDWDALVWLLYDSDYRLQEAWLWEVDDYRRRFSVRVPTKLWGWGSRVLPSGRFTRRGLDDVSSMPQSDPTM